MAAEPEPSPWLSTRELYDIHFNNMVSELAEDFTKVEIQKLCFIFQKLLPGSFFDEHGQNALKVFEYLMRKKYLFSSDKPQKLAQLMELLALPEKKERVEAFIDKFKDIEMVPIMQQRILPPTPSALPVEEEAESNYVRFQRPNTAPPPTSPISTSPKMTCLTARPVQCDSSSIHSDELKPGVGYVTYARSKSAASISKFSDQGSSTDDEDVIYAEPYTDILRPLTSQEVFPLLQERMKLLVNPLRDIVTNKDKKILASPPFHCHLPKCTFYLEVLPLDGECLSARLCLKPGSEDLGYLSSNFYLVELKVVQRKNTAQRTSQALYFHSALMKKPNTDLIMESTGDSADENVKEKTSMSGDHPIKKQHSTGLCVATFPSIMTHEMLMEKKLISKPCLLLYFTLKLYQTR